MWACLLCASSIEPVGLLCGRCANEISADHKHAPGIIVSRVPAAAAVAWLIDEWGQPHATSARVTIGRERDRNDIAIADLAISGEHAELEHDDGRWRVRDRGSANGTRLDDGPRLRTAELPHRARLWLGPIGFHFWSRRALPAGEIAPPRVRTVVPAGAGFLLLARRRGEIRVRAAAGHTIDRAPGELEYHAPKRPRAARAALGRLQFQLLRRLCEAAMTTDGGFARSVATRELLRVLPFQSSSPEPNHVRQVVAGLRAALERAGVPGGSSAGTDGVISAEEGLGYRLNWHVERLERT
jgi:FHA domain